MFPLTQTEIAKLALSHYLTHRRFPGEYINGRRVRISYVNPPIPDRSCDYCASWFDNDLGDPQGYGPTAADALQDLKEKCE